jgi:membrane protease YdiL (CAAX protease family)
MGQYAVLALLLAAILSLLGSGAKQRLRLVLHRRPAYIWVAPVLLSAVFAGAAWMAGAFSLRLAALILGYACGPVLCAFLQAPGLIERPSGLDFAAILLLWLPLEFAAGASLVPRASQSFLHGVAYGIAILLGLVLFIGYRSFPGMKFNLPERRRDYRLPLTAFVLLAPVLAVVGIGIGFIPMPHAPAASASRMFSAVGIIYLGTALPEEILFRSLIQNMLMLRFGAGLRMLLAASLIFGAAHLDNGPQPLPNWRYFILATIAGFAYGRVFQRASTVLSSAGLHMLVDWTKHFFF